MPNIIPELDFYVFLIFNRGTTCWMIQIHSAIIVFLYVVLECNGI